MKSVNSLDQIRDILPKENGGINIKNAKLAYKGELDFWKIPGKKGDRVVPAGIMEEDVIVTSKAFENLGKILEDSRENILDILDLSDVGSHLNKKAQDTSNEIHKVLDRYFLPEDFNDAVNLTNVTMQDKIYPGVVSRVNKDSIIVTIGSVNGKPKEYQISLTDGKNALRKRKFSRGNYVFLDFKKDSDSVELVAGKDFKNQRIAELKNIGIDINSNNTFFYMTRSGQNLEGRVIGFGEDLGGRQVIFKTKKGKTFPVSMQALEKGMKLGSQKYRETLKKEKELSNQKKEKKAKKSEMNNSKEKSVA